MVILGIDPGYAIVGWGVIEKLSNGKCVVVNYGAITTDKDMPFPDRLLKIKKDLEELIEKLTKEMRAAAKILEFEHAAYLRDRIEKLRQGK